MSKRDKELHALRDQQENEILRRVLFWLGAAVALELLVLLTNRFYINYTTDEIMLASGIMKVLEVLQYVGVIVGAGLFAWAMVGRKQKAGSGICRTISATFFVSISVCAFLFLHFGKACVSVLLVGIPAVAGLIMIYYLYQREFFAMATVSGLGILGLWLYRAGSTQYISLYYTYAIISCLLIAAVFFFCRGMEKKDGILVLGQREIPFFTPKANYKALWISCATVVALLLLAPVLGTFFAYYAFLALIVWIFVMAVYFTSRLM